MLCWCSCYSADELRPSSFCIDFRWVIDASDPILVIKPYWLDKILTGAKTLELRSNSCRSKIGLNIWLAASGTSSVCAKAMIAECRVINSQEELNALRPEHCYVGNLPYHPTYAWKLVNVACCPQPIAIHRKRGSVVWQIGP